MFAVLQSNRLRIYSRLSVPSQCGAYLWFLQHDTPPCLGRSASLLQGNRLPPALRILLSLHVSEERYRESE